jgi:hypothetical protein
VKVEGFAGDAERFVTNVGRARCGGRRRSAGLLAVTTDRFDGASPALLLATIATFALDLLAQEEIKS